LDNRRSSVNSEEGIEWRQLLLTACADDMAKPTTAGIEELDLFKDLPLEDQLILLKEGIVGVGYLLCMLRIDIEKYTVIMTAVDRKLHLCFNIHSWKMQPWNKEAFHTWDTLIASIPQFLMKDALLINLLCLIFFFSDKTGLSSSQAILTEKIIYTELLDKYINARIKGGDWDTTSDFVWKVINGLLDGMMCANSMYVRLARQMEECLTMGGIR